MIPLYKPYMPAELPELNSILHSGALAYGKWGRLFEAKLGDYIGESRIATTNSYNSAMLVVMSVIGIKPGDEIIASPMSCLASNQPFATQNATVIWADIDPQTGTLDPTSVKSKITGKSKAIFHNHYCGYPGYIDEINQIGQNNGIVVVDDAIEAFGSEYKGKRIGNVGTDITVFSFQAVRLPNTVDGGAIAFNNDGLFEKAQLVRDYGINRRHFRDSNGEIDPMSDINIPGYGATINEIYSYIGCKQIEEFDQLLSLHRVNATKWRNYFSNANSEKVLQINKDSNPNYWIFGVLSDNKLASILKYREMGYYASGVHLNNNQYSVFGVTDHLPGVAEFYRRFLALPCGWWTEINIYNNV